MTAVEFRCPECRTVRGHCAGCRVPWANRHWVRALMVAAAETTARGLAESGFTFITGKSLSEEPTPRSRRR